MRHHVRLRMSQEHEQTGIQQTLRANDGRMREVWLSKRQEQSHDNHELELQNTGPAQSGRTDFSK